LAAPELLAKETFNVSKGKISAALASLVTEDCIFLAPNAPPMRGRTIVEQLYRNLFARYNLVQSFHFEETQCMGDWAFAWGTDDITMTPVAGGDALHFVGHGMSFCVATWTEPGVSPAESTTRRARHKTSDQLTRLDKIGNTHPLWNFASKSWESTNFAIAGADQFNFSDKYGTPAELVTANSAQPECRVSSGMVRGTAV
jgi:hypothetical protein